MAGGGKEPLPCALYAVANLHVGFFASSVTDALQHCLNNCTIFCEKLNKFYSKRSIEISYL